MAHDLRCDWQSPATTEPDLESETPAISTYPEVEDREEAVREVFGLPSNVPLPRVEEAGLLAYYHYLAVHLRFPFSAHFYQDSGAIEGGDYRVTVLGLVHPFRCHTDRASGLLCTVRKGRMLLELPLAELEVREEDSHHWLVEDYWYWFWNCQ